MPVEKKVAVRGLLVLADASLNQRRVFQGREAEADVFANFSQCLRTDHALSLRGIEVRPAGIVGNLESAAIAAGNAVAEFAAVIRPHGHRLIAEAVVASGRTKEENVLLGRSYQAPNSFRKQAFLATGPQAKT